MLSFIHFTILTFVMKLIVLTYCSHETLSNMRQQKFSLAEEKRYKQAVKIYLFNINFYIVTTK